MIISASNSLIVFDKKMRNADHIIPVALREAFKLPVLTGHCSQTWIYSIMYRIWHRGATGPHILAAKSLKRFVFLLEKW